MELKFKLTIIFLSVCLTATIVYAVESKIYVDYNFMGNDVYNATWINATYFYGSGEYLTGLVGGAGLNYWQAGSVWMWANTTAGGKHYINVTAINATVVYENSVSLTDKYWELTDTMSNQGLWGVNVSNYTFYIDNSTERALFESIFNVSYESTFNTTYDAFVVANISNVSNSTLYWDEILQQSEISITESQISDLQSYLLGEADPIWNANYSLVGFLANQGLWNINASNYTDYVGNTSERTLFESIFNASYESTFNTTYDAFVAANISSISNSTIWWNGTDIFPILYEANISDLAHTNLTEADVQTYINNTADDYFQIKAKDLLCTDCLDGTEIAELTDADISNTLTASVLVAAANIDIGNYNLTSAGLRLADDEKIYLGTDDDALIYFNGTHLILEG